MALFLTLKKVVQSTCRALPLQLQKYVKCHKLPPPKKKNSQNMGEKFCVFFSALDTCIC